MLSALSSRLRASCLLGHRLEPHGRLDGRRIISRPASNGRWPRSQPQTKPRQTHKGTEVNSPTDQHDPKSSSLLEELFPEEAQRRHEPTATEREVPRLALDVPKPTSDEEVKTPKAPFVMNKSMSRTYKLLETQRGETSVLVLRNASKNLVEDDFRRLIPQGKHIEGWNLTQGDIIKIIPGRNTATLERENFYLLLFKSPVSAFTYQTHVTRVHKLAQSQTPDSLISPIPTPPNYLSGGQDLDALLQSYALIPPSQTIELRQLSRPWTPLVEQIVRHQGYPHIVNRPNKSPVEVLLRLEGPKLSIPLVRSALVAAARRRDVPWTGVEVTKIPIEKWVAKNPDVSPLNPKNGLKDYELLESNSSESVQGGDGIEESDSRSSGGRLPPACYIVGLQTEAEAQTFVRYWHRRPMELSIDGFDYGDVAPIVNAEIL